MQRRTKKRSYNQRLREERLNASWSQQDLANRLGTTINNVSRWELGQTLPGPYFRAKLCALFDKSEEELGLVEGNPATTTREEAGAPPTQSSSEDGFALWTVPYPRNPHFTGREEILDQLDHSLSPEEPDGRPI